MLIVDGRQTDNQTIHDIDSLLPSLLLSYSYRIYHSTYLHFCSMPIPASTTHGVRQLFPLLHNQISCSMPALFFHGTGFEEPTSRGVLEV